MSGELAAFLLARIDDDEQMAREATPGPWRAAEMYPECFYVQADSDRNVASESSYGNIEPADVGHIVRWNPARILAGCKAKRGIIKLHARDHECSTYDHHGEVDSCTWVIDVCSTLQLLALPYADHPDYRQEWRP